MGPSSFPENDPEDDHFGDEEFSDAEEAYEAFLFDQEEAGKIEIPQSRADETRIAKQRSWNSLEGRLLELASWIDDQLPVSDVSVANFSTHELVPFCLTGAAPARADWGLDSKDGLTYLQQYTELRIIEESYRILDRVVDSIDSCLEEAATKNQDFGLIYRGVWLEFVRHLQEPHIAEYVHEIDTGGSIYASALKYAMDVHTVGTLEARFGPRPSMIAHFTCTDCLEDAVVSFLSDQGGFFVAGETSYRYQWPYATDPHEIRASIEQVQERRARFEHVYGDELRQLLDGSGAFTNLAEAMKWAPRPKNVRGGAFYDHYRELTEMEDALEKRLAYVERVRADLHGSISLLVLEDGSVDILFTGETGDPAVILCEDIYCKTEPKLYISSEMSTHLASRTVAIDFRDMLSTRIFAVLKSLEHVRHNHADHQDLEGQLLSMQLAHDEHKPSIEQYVDLAQALARHFAATQHQAVEGMCQTAEEIEARTGLEVKRLFGGFHEFRDFVIGPPDEYVPDDLVGCASHLKHFFRGATDASITEWAESAARKAGGSRICDELSNDQLEAYDRYVDQLFDIVRVEGWLRRFWESTPGDARSRAAQLKAARGLS